MERIVLMHVLECNNGCSCELHPFGCENSLVLNQDDWDAGFNLHLHAMKATNKLACYIIGSDGSNGCHAGFMTREYAARDNGPWLDGAIVEIMTVFTPKSENHSMRCLHNHNRGYAYLIVLN
jgi:hypothetical protein